MGALLHISDNRIIHGNIVITLSEYTKNYHLYINHDTEYDHTIYNANVLADASQIMPRITFSSLNEFLNITEPVCANSGHIQRAVIDPRYCMLNQLKQIGSHLFAQESKVYDDEKEKYIRLKQNCADKNSKCHAALVKTQIDKAITYCVQTSAPFWKKLYITQINNIININGNLNIKKLFLDTIDAFDEMNSNYNCFNENLTKGKL